MSAHLQLASASSAGIYLVIVGVVIVAVLIGAFVLGSRRKRREPPPNVHPPHVPDRPDPEAWSTPPDTPGRAPHGHRAPDDPR
ncbi:DUF6479 family protein [Streptacidiphilus carbonis]|uniref:DUF6479 family protein n=1 Tax=Streptacidiphilus carbonis TaxID=105422 RepID=UPI000693649C|nr:DUF6479 family protein [Streptacidiphilus carbonis]